MTHRVPPLELGFAYSLASQREADAASWLMGKAVQDELGAMLFLHAHGSSHSPSMPPPKEKRLTDTHEI